MRNWLVVISIVVLLIGYQMPVRAGDLTDHFVFEQGDRLMGRIGRDGAAEVLSDAAHYEKVQGARNRYYILLRSDDRQSWLTILECDSLGGLRRVRACSDAKLREATAILSAKIDQADRLAVTVHISPEEDQTLVVALRN